MSSRRTLRVAESIRKIVSMSIQTDLRDPRIKGMVTVTKVEVAGDLRHAKVFVSILGDEATERLSLAGLNSSRGFLQSKLADGLDLRYTPKLHFELDEGVKKLAEVQRLLSEVLPRPPVEDEDVEEEEEEDEETEGDEADPSDDEPTEEFSEGGESDDEGESEETRPR